MIARAWQGVIARHNPQPTTKNANHDYSGKSKRLGSIRLGLGRDSPIPTAVSDGATPQGGEIGDETAVLGTTIGLSRPGGDQPSGAAEESAVSRRAAIRNREKGLGV